MMLQYIYLIGYRFYAIHLDLYNQRSKNIKQYISLIILLAFRI